MRTILIRTLAMSTAALIGLSQGIGVLGKELDADRVLADGVIETAVSVQVPVALPAEETQVFAEAVDPAQVQPAADVDGDEPKLVDPTSNARLETVEIPALARRFTFDGYVITDEEGNVHFLSDKDGNVSLDDETAAYLDRLVAAGVTNAAAKESWSAFVPPETLSELLGENTQLPADDNYLKFTVTDEQLGVFLSVARYDGEGKVEELRPFLLRKETSGENRDFLRWAARAEDGRLLFTADWDGKISYDMTPQVYYNTKVSRLASDPAANYGYFDVKGLIRSMLDMNNEEIENRLKKGVVSSLYTNENGKTVSADEQEAGTDGQAVTATSVTSGGQVATTDVADGQAATADNATSGQAAAANKESKIGRTYGKMTVDGEEVENKNASEVLAALCDSDDAAFTFTVPGKDIFPKLVRDTANGEVRSEEDAKSMFDSENAFLQAIADGALEWTDPADMDFVLRRITDDERAGSEDKYPADVKLICAASGGGTMFVADADGTTYTFADDMVAYSADAGFYYPQGTTTVIVKKKTDGSGKATVIDPAAGDKKAGTDGASGQADGTDKTDADKAATDKSSDGGKAGTSEQAGTDGKSNSGTFSGTDAMGNGGTSGAGSSGTDKSGDTTGGKSGSDASTGTDVTGNGGTNDSGAGSSDNSAGSGTSTDGNAAGSEASSNNSGGENTGSNTSSGTAGDSSSTGNSGDTSGGSDTSSSGNDGNTSGSGSGSESNNSSSNGPTGRLMQTIRQLVALTSVHAAPVSGGDSTTDSGASNDSGSDSSSSNTTSGSGTDSSSSNTTSDSGTGSGSSSNATGTGNASGSGDNTNNANSNTNESQAAGASANGGSDGTNTQGSGDAVSNGNGTAIDSTAGEAKKTDAAVDGTSVGTDPAAVKPGETPAENAVSAPAATDSAGAVTDGTQPLLEIEIPVERKAYVKSISSLHIDTLPKVGETVHFIVQGQIFTVGVYDKRPDAEYPWFIVKGRSLPDTWNITNSKDVDVLASFYTDNPEIVALLGKTAEIQNRGFAIEENTLNLLTDEAAAAAKASLTEQIRKEEVITKPVDVKIVKGDKDKDKDKKVKEAGEKNPEDTEDEAVEAVADPEADMTEGTDAKTDVTNPEDASAAQMGEGEQPEAAQTEGTETDSAETNETGAEDEGTVSGTSITDNASVIDANDGAFDGNDNGSAGASKTTNLAEFEESRKTESPTHVDRTTE